MDFNVAKKRKSQVFMVDSINSTEYDFLATHIPFRKIAFRYGIGNSLLENVDEQTAFYKLFKDPSISDKHQLIIVEGSSGSGKSHFIRWLNANLKSDNDAKASFEKSFISFWV
jgi:ABC-type multidrug transport system fused ATPase/permease subunit